MARRSLVLDQAVESEGNKKKSRKKLIVGIAMLGVIPVIGSTLAASITINSGSIEFGQGYQTVAACDSSITVALTSTYSNSSNFTVNAVNLSGVDTCNGKTLTVHLRNSSGTSLSSTTISATTTTTYSWNPTNVDATAVAKVTVESS